MAWMRNKSEPETTTPAASQPTRQPVASGSRQESRMEPIVNIGQSVQIKGELSGNEDLTIEGQVDGKIMLKDHNLTIGANGRISAEIRAKNVAVLGKVIGNIVADDKVELAATGSVQGDIRAPRVAVADGAKFKGSIDMERKPGAPAARPEAGAPASAADTVRPGGGATSPAREMPRSASPAK